MAKPPPSISSDAFIQQFLTWILNTYGSEEARREGPRGPTVEVGLRLRPEHVAALGTAAHRRGVPPTTILQEVLDAWLAEEYARSR